MTMSAMVPATTSNKKKNKNDSVEHLGRTTDVNVAGKTLKEVQVRRSECHYGTVRRWRYRVQEWEKYLAQTSITDTGELKPLPDAETFFFANNNNDLAATSFGDNNDSVENLIWGAAKDSLKSLHGSFQRNQAELAALQSDNSYQLQMSSQESTSRTVDDDEQEPNAVGIPSNLNLNSEQMAWFKSMQEKERIKDNQERIKDREAYVKANQEIIKERIKASEARIKDRLEQIKTSHEKTRNTLGELTGKGNETAGTGISFVLDTKRFNEVASIPSSSPVKTIRSAEPDTSFLKDLLKKEEIVPKQGELCGFQAFVATLMEQSIEVRKKKGGIDKRIQASVDAIRNWPAAIVEQRRWTMGIFGRPPPKGCETIADQPILCALIFQILDILGQSSKYVGSEQVLAPVENIGRGRRIDFVVDEHREFLHVLLPEMIGLVIEVKSTSHHKSKEFKKNQERAREQVIGHLAKRLRCAFDFGGIGQDDVVRGVVLSMTSVQVLEMQLTRIGTHEVDIVFRQTPHVPLLGGRFVPETIREAVKWDMESNGMLLLASALLGMSRKSSLFGRGREQIKIDDISAANYYSSHGQEGLDCAQHVGIEMQSFLGSGTFAHVVHLGEDRFMKIPRSRRMVKSLTRESEILQRLMTYEQPRFPRIMPWGVSVVNLSIRSQISEMNVLRLQGIVGCSLSRYCENNHPEMRANIHRVIQDVYEALKHAHRKRVFHMDVRPSNIIVKRKKEGFDVLLADWGCSLLTNEEIGKGRFVGCIPYAHDELLGDRKRKALKPKAEFDFASLGYTWYHVVMGVIGWKFDRPQPVTDEIKARQQIMERFIEDEDRLNDTLCPVPDVRKVFVKTNTRKRKFISRRPTRRTSRAT